MIVRPLLKILLQYGLRFPQITLFKNRFVASEISVSMATVSFNLFVCVEEGRNLRLPVAVARHGDFFQPEPRHENAWTSGNRRTRKGLHHAISRRNLTVNILGSCDRFSPRI